MRSDHFVLIRFLGTFLALGALTGCAVTGSPAASQTGFGASPERGGGSAGAPAGSPCRGTQWTLAEAREGMPFEVQLPHHELANSETPVSVWECPSGRSVAFQYSTGVFLAQALNTLKDPVEVYERMAASYPEFSMEVIKGVPANFVDPTKAREADGGVDFVLDGVRIFVTGNGHILLERLIEIAESLRADSE